MFYTNGFFSIGPADLSRFDQLTIKVEGIHDDHPPKLVQFEAESPFFFPSFGTSIVSTSNLDR
jgi:hypothetical protein